MSTPRVKVHSYTWDRGKPSPITGVMLYSGSTRAFIPGRDLRRIADALHDHADQLEATE